MIALYYSQLPNTRISLKNLPGFCDSVQFFQDMLTHNPEWRQSVALLAPLAVFANYAGEIVKRLEHGAHMNKLLHIFSAIEDEHHNYFVLL